MPRPQIRAYALANPNEFWVKKVKPGNHPCPDWNNTSLHLMQGCKKSNCCYLPCVALKVRANCASVV